MTIIIFAYLFYIGFAAAIGVYRRWLMGALNILNILLFAPVLIAFALTDVVLNYTVFLLLMGIPPDRCYTISARLGFYHLNPRCTEYQRAVAGFICEKLLNPIDPSGSHC